MYSDKSYELTKSEFDYLLPAIRKKLNSRGNKYYFTGSLEDLRDMLSRLQGLYGSFDEDMPNPALVSKCAKAGSIELFRKAVKSSNHPLKENYQRFFGEL